MLRRFRGLSLRRTGTLVSTFAIGMVLLLAAPSPAGPSSGTGLPPKVKPAVGNGRSVHAPQGTEISPRGGAVRFGFCGGDDWEPEIAVAPDGKHAYAVLSHFSGDPTCDPSSANPNRIYIHVSSDGGRTWEPPHVVADLVGGRNYPSQVDCVVTVDPLTGAVYVSFLAYGIEDESDVAVAKSTDFGQTFTAVKVNGPRCTDLCDHPWTAAYGDDVYTAYGAGGQHWLSRSSDGGSSWKEKLILNADTDAFPEGAVLDSKHNVWFAWGDCINEECRGKVAGNYRVSKTLAGTSKTTFGLVATAPAGPRCPYDPDCGFAYFGIQNDVAIDAAGNLYVVWQDGQDHSKAKSPPIVQLSRCRAHRDCTSSRNWKYVSRVDDKTATGCARSRCYALFPRVEGGAANQIAAVWMDDRLGSPLNHKNGWNVWLRTSTTGGASWTGPSVRVSQFDPNRKESKPNGFLFPYGDYQGIDIRTGKHSTKALMIWGEGNNYTGGPANPGHILYRTIGI
jgi:hypothetical protein